MFVIHPYAGQQLPTGIRSEEVVVTIAGRVGEVEEMGTLGLVELQGAGDGVEHTVGDTAEASAFQLGVVIDADPGEQRYLLATRLSTTRRHDG